MTTPEPVPLPPSNSSNPSDSTDKLLIIFCHLSLFLGVGILLPLIVYLAKRQEAPLVAQHARETLNFHISIIFYAIASCFLIIVIIGVPLLIAVIIGAIVCPILGAIRASEGNFYTYPLTIRLIS